MGARVLVVDDEPDIVNSFADLIEVALPGTSVTKASSGAEALEHMRRETFDIILSDFRMPGMSGLALLEEASRVAPGIATVMMTAYPDLDVVLTAVNAHRARAFLMKPVDPTELIDTVQAVIVAKAAAQLRDQALVAALRTSGI